jgi:hypothetical protein
MSPSSDEEASGPGDEAAPGSPTSTGEAGPASAASPSEQAAPPEHAPEATANPESKDATARVATDSPAPNAPPPPGFLAYTFLTLLSLGFVVWLIFTWTGYKEKYSQIAEGWHLGGTKMIEITLIRDDKKNLACASDKTFGAIHCGFHRNGQSTGTSPETDPTVLQPYNTVKNELFLAAGLWQSPILSGTLPKERFTVVCNYHVVGVLRSAALRWSPTGSFNPLDQSVAVGSLSDCVIPQ